jgi:hypothetical protein
MWHCTICCNHRAITAAGVKWETEAVLERSKMKEEGDATSAEEDILTLSNTFLRMF